MRTLSDIPRRLVIAIGGNAVHPEDISGTSDEQKDVARHTAEALLPLAELDNELVITHGNGPVVGIDHRITNLRWEISELER